MNARSNVLVCRLLISTIRVLNLLGIPLRRVHSLLEIRLNRELLLLLDWNVLSLGLAL